MVRISRIEACTAVVPLETATSFATRRVVERQYALVRVHCDDGTSGIGFCYGGSSFGDLAASAALDLLAPVLIGQDPHRTEGLWDEMYQEALLHGRAGSVMRAISMLDIALWDRNASAAGLPLWKMLGATSSGTVPAYASGGYYLDGKGPDELANEVRGYVDAGFRAVKIKVGRLSDREERERVRAVRAAIGPDVLLMLDANNAWLDLPSALRAIEGFADFDPYWIEEPFSPDDIANHARLAARLPFAVATGEIEAGRWRHKALLDAEGAIILQTDAAVCGGITEFRRIAALAAAYGVTLAPHWFHDLHAPLVGATSNAQWVEFFPGDDVLNFRKLVDAQLEVVDGDLRLHDRPGLGFGFDDAVLEVVSTGWRATSE